MQGGGKRERGREREREGERERGGHEYTINYRI